MDENKPTEEQFNESFNEDFDFGEGEAPETPMQKPVSGGTTGGPKPPIVSLVVLIVLSGVIWAGYKFYRSKSTAKAAPSITEVAKTSVTGATGIQPPSTIAAVPVTTPTPTQPTAQAPTPGLGTGMETTTPTPSASVMPTTPGSRTAATNEANFGEIAHAFSSADQGVSGAPATLPAQTPAQATQPSGGQPGKVTGGSIQDLQKELFNPEKTATTGSQANEITVLVQNLNKLNQQIDFILDKIKYLDSYTQEVSENLSKFNEAITAMDRRLSMLTNTTTTLSKDVGNVRSEVGQVRRVLREDGLDINLGAVGNGRRKTENDAMVSIEEPEYMVHAVIPGRAWLKSRKGHIVTITEGDTVGNYGKILVIDASNGVVLTSSGVTFH